MQYVRVMQHASSADIVCPCCLACRGKAGKLKRRTLVHSGDPENLIGYHIALLSLIKTLCFAHSPDDRIKITVLLPPDAILEDISDKDCPVPAKIHLLSIFHAAYVQGGPRVGHLRCFLSLPTSLRHIMPIAMYRARFWTRFSRSAPHIKVFSRRRR